MPFLDLSERVAAVRDRIGAALQRGGRPGEAVTVVAVTKTHGPEAVSAAWQAGIPDVGENRVQEALGKMPHVAAPVRWHLIGHMQRNKVDALDHFALLHSLDSSRLADAVHSRGVARGRPVEALLQVNGSGETSKGGFPPGDVAAEAERLREMPGIRLVGVMTMAPFVDDERILRATFAAARAARGVLQGAGHPAAVLSMGMSNDYEIAIEEGATMIRLGTVLFGARPT